MTRVRGQLESVRGEVRGVVNELTYLEELEKRRSERGVVSKLYIHAGRVFFFFGLDADWFVTF
jgi:hypothetical protein